jgi:tRNA(Ile)-lysidine synthase
VTTGDHAPITDDECTRLLSPLLPFPTLVLAVSGGPDSTALLHLAHRWARHQRRPAEALLAVTVDHGLRPESAAEAAAVARLARELGVGHRTLRWDGPAPATGLQAAARAARYRLLAAAAADFRGAAIVTAHSADDQAETLLMRLARGSGVDGLAAIPTQSRLAVDDDAHGSGCTVLRPLLGIARSRLIATLAAAAIPYADDPSNRDRRFERVRLREVMATLAALGLTRDALARTARRLRAAQEVLERAADDLEMCAVGSLASLVHRLDLPLLAAAPEETAVRVLRRVLLRAGGAARPADLGTVELAAARLRSSSTPPTAFTIGGCIVDFDTTGPDFPPRSARLYREPDRDGGLPRLTVAPGQTLTWDARFRVALAPGHPEPVEVGPLGPTWFELAAAFPGLAALALPAAAARGIPAFRGPDGLIAVPLLAALADELGKREAARHLAGPVAETGSQEGPVCRSWPVGRVAGPTQASFGSENGS